MLHTGNSYNPENGLENRFESSIRNAASVLVKEDNEPIEAKTTGAMPLFSDYKNGGDGMDHISPFVKTDKTTDAENGKSKT